MSEQVSMILDDSVLWAGRAQLLALRLRSAEMGIGGFGRLRGINKNHFRKFLVLCLPRSAAAGCGIRPSNSSHSLAWHATYELLCNKSYIVEFLIKYLYHRKISIQAECLSLLLLLAG